MQRSGRFKKVSEDREENVSIVYTFTKEKLEEFKDMSVSQRLQWLEETNLFINKTIGFKKRAITDPRFEGLE
ncbi:MAG TPA: hypothetical protein DDY34_16500 [Bacteroidales bacterium]|nr:hypothetical protein [Bacteroidales bacterium]